MAAINFRDIDTGELKTKLTEGEEQMFRLRFQMKMGQVEGLKKYRELRRDRARILGVLREREISEGKGK